MAQRREVALSVCDGCAAMEIVDDSLPEHHYRDRGDASCSSLLPTTKPLRNQSEQRFGTQLGNLIDSGLKGLLHRFRLPFQHGSGRTDVGTLPRFSASGRQPSGNARLLRLASLFCFSGAGSLGFNTFSMLLQGLQQDVRLSAADFIFSIQQGGGIAMQECGFRHISDRSNLLNAFRRNCYRRDPGLPASSTQSHLASAS